MALAPMKLQSSPTQEYGAITTIFWQSFTSGCLIHNGTYLTLSLTLTITLSLLTLILGTVVNKAPTSKG